MTRLSGLHWSTLILVAACGGSQPPPEPPPPPPAPVATVMPAAATTPAPSSQMSPEPSKEAPKSAAPTPVVRYADGFATPESVLYDEAEDRYLVSNINGKPPEADNNGYISELSPDGKVVKAKFIAGGIDKVKLDAPKGTGIAGGGLYGSDINVGRKFDLKTRAPKGRNP